MLQITGKPVPKEATEEQFEDDFQSKANLVSLKSKIPSLWGCSHTITENDTTLPITLEKLLNFKDYFYLSSIFKTSVLLVLFMRQYEYVNVLYAVLYMTRKLRY